MSKPKAPAPPDPVATANAQTASNLATARTEAELNRYNQNTPYGSVNWTNNGDQWTQTTTESPEEARLRQLSQQQGTALGELGLEQTGRVSDILSQPYNPRRLNLADALGDYNGDVEARTRELATRGLDTQFNRSEESLRSRLANQGINAGTEAFGAELSAFNEGKGNAYAAAELAARDTARADRGQMLSEALTQYGSDTTADQAARTNPLNEIIALASGVQTNPINPGQGAQVGVNGTDIAGITQAAFNNQMAGYNTIMNSRNALLGSIAGLGGAALGSPWLWKAL